MDQVGVNAPGNPIRMIFFPLEYSRMLTFFGGNSMSSSKDGSMSPSLMVGMVVVYPNSKKTMNLLLSTKFAMFQRSPTVEPPSTLRIF